jgi:hypothetical protein
MVHIKKLCNNKMTKIAILQYNSPNNTLIDANNVNT